jgi:orotate phosphoribosyltransferase
MGFNKEKFIQFALDNNVAGFADKPITLSSGRQSYWYANWRKVASDVFLIDRLSDFVIDFSDHVEIEDSSFVGVPEGATKLGLIVQYKLVRNYKIDRHPLTMIRANPKSHGYHEGVFLGVPEGNVVILEDVTTTGRSLVANIEKLVNAGTSISAAITLTDRLEKTKQGESVERLLRSGMDVPFYAMSTALDLLPRAVEKYKPSGEIIRKVEEEYNRFGIIPIGLS